MAFNGGGWNKAEKKMKGFQLGLVNEMGNGVGLQFSMWSIAETILGVQFGALYTTSKAVMGLQYGIWNHADKSTGVQLGLINEAEKANFFQFGAINTTSTVNGFQCCVYNNVKNLNGIQLGWINRVTGSLRGMQIGLLNISSGTGGAGFMPIINIGF